MGTEDHPRCFRITSATKAGGKDWSALIGSTLCKACYARFSRHGNLRGASQAVAAPRPSNALCAENLPQPGHGQGAAAAAAPACDDVLNEGTPPPDPPDPPPPDLSSLLPSQFVLDPREYISTDSESEDLGGGEEQEPIRKPDVFNACELHQLVSCFGLSRALLLHVVLAPPLFVLQFSHSTCSLSCPADTAASLQQFFSGYWTLWASLDVELGCTVRAVVRAILV